MFGLFKKKHSARDLGRALALSLQTSVDVDSNEAEKISRVGIDENRWYNEIYFLCGSAIFYSSIDCLGQSPAGEELREGFMEVFRKRAEVNQTEAGLFRIFQSRIAEYCKLDASFVPGTFDPVMAAFSTKFTESGPNAVVVASILARDHYDAHKVSAKLAMQNAGLSA